MSQQSFHHNESLLQWIWENLEFDTQNLHTTKGKKVTVVHPGKLNKGAGPDFLGAHVLIGGVEFHGSIEIHIDPVSWNSHGHQHDSTYNSVVLHVVYTSKSSRKIKRQDGTIMPELPIEPALTKPIQNLFKASQKNLLPCSNNLRFINQQAFQHQVQKAHKEYFNFKTEQFLQKYDPSLPPSQAWKQALSHHLFIGLGISQNRAPMDALFKTILDADLQPDRNNFTDKVLRMAFRPANHHKFSWTETGLRPASHPQKRIRQAAEVYTAINGMPFSTFLKTGIESWNKLFKTVPADSQPGAQMKSILFNTVFLPALYFLGDLFSHEKLRKQAIDQWSSTRQPVPLSIKHPFQNTGFSINNRTHKLGLAHQLKRYCNKLECHRCEVFKNAIRS